MEWQACCIEGVLKRSWYLTGMGSPHQARIKVLVTIASTEPASIVAPGLELRRTGERYFPHNTPSCMKSSTRLDCALFHEIWHAGKMPQPLLGSVDADGFVWTVPRQMFVRLYVATGDAKTAARDAHLPDDDPPADLLAHDSMKAKIAELHEAVLRRFHETTDTVMSRYSNIAEGNLLDYLALGDKHPVHGRVVPGNVSLKDMETMPRHMQQRLKKFKITTTAQGDTNFEIELHDPMKANDMLTRILGLDGERDPEDAKQTATAIYEFVNELDQLDDNYDNPDPEATNADASSDEPGAPADEHPSDQDS